MKKLLSLVLTAAMLLSAAAFQSFAAEDGEIGDSVTWEITDDGELIIEGTGAIPDSDSESPWIDYALDVNTLIIGEGITYIGQYAFRGMESIFEVEMADSVTEIGYGAFAGCTCIDYIELSENLVSIGIDAFNGCSALEEIVAGDKLVSIGSDAFKDTPIISKAKNNTLIYVGNVVVTYKGNAPANTAIELEDGTVGIADGAFKNQASIVSVTFPETMVHIGDEAFFGCGNLSEPQFNDGLTYIGEMAFYSSTSFDEVTIPQSVTTIGAKAFGWLKDPAWGDKKNASFTVIGYTGTAAEEYAVDSANGFTFKSLGEAETPTPAYDKGDVNMDGRVNAKDVLMIKRYIVSMVELSDEAKELADVYADGRVNARDILYLKRSVVGIAD